MNISALWPAHGVDPLNHYGTLAGKLFALHGMGTTLERPLLICLRGASIDAAESHPMRSVAAYDDTGVLLSADRVPVVFPMSSHAYQVNSKLSPDVDGDGRGDVGTICPGHYVLKYLKTGKYPTLSVSQPDGSDPECWRDTNHDGVISHDESKRYRATQILVHGGIDDPPDSPHHYSIGCQCVPLVWRRELISRLGPDGLCDYILVNAEDAARLMTGEAPQNIA